MTKTFKAILGLILAWALVAQTGVVAIAQSPTITSMHTAATATGNGTALIVSGPAGNPANTIGAAGVQIANSAGTFTITFETLTSGSTWTAVMATNMTDDVRATTATAAGQYTVLLGGAVQLRARISACSGCNVTVVGRLVPGLVARVASGSGGGGSGTVTSVGWTGGIVSVATATTTPAFTIAGTPGGVPYFSSASTWASSTALAANAIVIGGGAGTAPSTTTTGTGVLTALAVNTGSAGAFVVNGGAGGTPSSLTLTNATALPPTTGISGWPANSSGVLTNNGSGTLSWGAAGGGTPGGSNKQIQVNASGSFGGATGFEYDATADWTLSQTPASGKTGMVVYEPTSTPPATVVGAPSLLQVHVKNGVTYWGLGYSSDATAMTWANYLYDDGTLIFQSDYNDNSGQLGVYFNPGTTSTTGYHSLNPASHLFAAASSTYGGLIEQSAGVFGLTLTTDYTGEGSVQTPLTWSSSGITLNAALSAPANSPSQITTDQNNYNPGTGWFQRWSSDASRNITGLSAGVDGQIIEIWNVGSNNIVLQNENASSTAANRFTTSTGADLTLSAGKCAKARYDNTSARWRAYLCN